jgi:hypothetical protein
MDLSNVHNWYTTDVNIFNNGPNETPLTIPVERSLAFKPKPKVAVECPFASKAHWKTDFELLEDLPPFQPGHHYIVSLPSVEFCKAAATEAGAALWILGTGPDALVKDSAGAIRGTTEMLRVV